MYETHNRRQPPSPSVCSLLPLCTTAKSNSVAPPGNTLEIYDHFVSRTALASILPTPSGLRPIMRKHDVIHKTGSKQNRKYITYSIVVRERPNHGPDNTYRKFREVWTCGFWATICKTVRPMLSDRLSVLSVCDVGVLWPNGWMDQDQTWHAGRPRPWPHCVRWGTSSPPQKRGRASNFRPMSIVAKRLDGSRCHLV